MSDEEMAFFEPRLDILPPPQRALWNDLILPSHFVLYGGTAIALHLGHRQSIDFDFFADRSIEPDSLLGGIAAFAGATVTQRARNTLSVLVDRGGGTVRLSFFGVPAMPRLRPPLVVSGHGIRVASLLDLAGTKASVVQVRAEAKDYIDLDAIMMHGGIDLATALAAGRAIYKAQFNPQITLKALAYYDDGDLATLPATTKQRLLTAVRSVELDRLPQIEGGAP